MKKTVLTNIYTLKQNKQKKISEANERINRIYNKHVGKIFRIIEVNDASEESDFNNYIIIDNENRPNSPTIKPTEPPTEDNKTYYTQQYLTFEAVTPGKFGFMKSQCNNVQYSLDNGSTWVNMDFAADITRLDSLSESDLVWTPTVEVGQKILWKGIYIYNEDAEVPGIGLFYSTGDYNISGNILSMIFADNFTTGNIDDVNTAYLLYGTFGLVNYQVLHKDTAQGTFKTIPGPIDCSNLILLTKHNGCEYYMTFQACGKMTAAPKLPVTELSGGDYMYMFSGCESLTTAPKLPATKLTDRCYGGMFAGCTSLVTAPKLSAPTLTIGCYVSMFSGCTNLNNITMLATDISASECLNGWVWGVSATGTFTKASGIEIPIATEDNNYSGIPGGWTVVDYVA